MKFYILAERMSVLMVSFFILLLFSRTPFAFVLDDKNKETRQVCGIQKTVTAYEESVERGACEDWAKPVGFITHWSNEGTLIASGVGVLVAPNIVLTSAHVIWDCVNNPEKCKFGIEMEKGHKAITAAFVPNGYTRWKEDFDTMRKLYAKFKEKMHELFKRDLTNFSSDQLILLASENKEKLDNETRQLISAIGNLNSAIKMSNSGALYDIGILHLEGEFPADLPYPSINTEKDPIKPQKLFGVSFNFMTSNNTGIKENIIKKHIAVFSVKKSEIYTGLLVNPVQLPADYVEKCDENGNVVEPSSFVYDYPPEVKDKPFMRGWTNPGDSGSPLIQPLKNNKAKVVGIASRVDPGTCGNNKTYTAGGIINEIWVSVSAHQKWIDEVLKEINK